MDYDYDNDGTIDVKDLRKIVKKLGIQNPEPHMELLLKTGNCG